MEKETHLTDSDGERPQDNFYHGVISKIFWSNETGVIHSDSGKEVPFIFAFVTLLGAPRQDINFLRPGMRVGFDVGWTSKGLRASTIKIYDLYQDDIVPEGSNASLSAAAQNLTLPDHPISRYRPPEIHESTEQPRYRQRRGRPRPQAQDQRPPDQRALEQSGQDARAAEQEQPRSEARPRGSEQQRPDMRARGQEQRRPEPRGQRQEQRRPDPRQQMQGQNRGDTRPQGQRREEPPRLSVTQNVRSSESAQGNATQQPDERSRRSRRRRGRR